MSYNVINHRFQKGYVDQGNKINFVRIMKLLNLFALLPDANKTLKLQKKFTAKTTENKF